MYEYKVLDVISIYDGDTMKVVLDLGFGITSRQSLRLDGINAPELRGATKIEGRKSRDWLRSRINDAMENGLTITVKTRKDKTGKYGRLLSKVFISGDSVSINEQLIHEGLAVRY